MGFDPLPRPVKNSVRRGLPSAAIYAPNSYSHKPQRLSKAGSLFFMFTGIYKSYFPEPGLFLQTRPLP